MYKKLLLILIFLIHLHLPNVAIALEQPKYKDLLSATLKQQIDAFLKEKFDTDISIYSFAEIDLNGDGVNEYITKRKACNPTEKQCIHNIIAEKNDAFILLSQIKARNIMIGNTSSHGIKDILVFKNETNDYNFDIYMWSPSEKMYIMNAE